MRKTIASLAFSLLFATSLMITDGTDSGQEVSYAAKAAATEVAAESETPTPFDIIWH
ncbi:hypothetical protein ABT024_10975 [Streptomyces sp. NPDC002812]|uniref:hypothetical protein n=1 Tax=Streptomyces sp. NPDC002812 TaxID=3154434 RepID=UPI0033232135